MPNDLNSTDAADAAAVKATGNAEAPTSPEAEKPDSASEQTPAAESKTARRRRICKGILKWTGIAFGVLLILLIIAVLFRNPIAKFAVRTVGTSLVSPRDEKGNALKDEKGNPVKIKVDVKDIDSSLSGWVRVTGFSVDNPREYDQERKAIEFKEVYVKINVGSLFTKKIEISEVKVDGLHIYCQLSAAGMNLKDIVDNLKANTASKKKKKKKKTEESETQVVVRHLKIADSSFDANFLPSISLDMEKENIGEDESKGGTSWKAFWGESTKTISSAVNSTGETVTNTGKKLKKIVGF